MNRVKSLVLPLLGALAIAGCATAPKPLQGEFAMVRPIDAERAEGARVRWGGSIIAVEPRPNETCFEVLGRHLNDSARPRPTDATDGRFLACRRGFYDPAVFSAGRDITVVGAISGREKRKVGEYEYAYPRVTADAVYLWPDRSEIIIENRSSPFFYHSPFWYGFHRPVILHRPIHRARVRAQVPAPKSSPVAPMAQAAPRSQR